MSEGPDHRPAEVPLDASRLTTSAIALHELFRSLLDAGFTERQAIMYLVESGRQHRE